MKMNKAFLFYSKRIVIARHEAILKALLSYYSYKIASCLPARIFICLVSVTFSLVLTEFDIFVKHTKLKPNEN